MAKFFVKIWNGKTVTVSITGADTVRKIKENIRKKIKMPVKSKICIFKENF